MAEAEEQPLPVSPQSEGRSEGGEEAPEGGAAAPEGGAAAGATDTAPPTAGSPGTEEPAGDTKKKSNGARSHRRGRVGGRASAMTGGRAGQLAVGVVWFRPMRAREWAGLRP